MELEDVIICEHENDGRLNMHLRSAEEGWEKEENDALTTNMLKKFKILLIGIAHFQPHVVPELAIYPVNMLRARRLEEKRKKNEFEEGRNEVKTGIRR